MGSADDKNASAAPKPPSWLNEKDDKHETAAPEAGSAEKKVPDAAEVPEASKEPAASKSDDDMLLGAPVSAGSSDSDDFLISEAEVPPGFGGGDVKSEVPAAPSAALNGNEAKPEQPEDVSPELEKIRTEMDQLEKIVDGLEFLSYLKPRLNRIRKSGCDPHDLVGLYRMASQVMFDNMMRQSEIMHHNKAEYEKRMRQLQEEMLFTQSSALVSGGHKNTPHKAEPAPSPARPRYSDPRAQAQADAYNAALEARRAAEKAAESSAKDAIAGDGAGSGPAGGLSATQLEVIRRQMEHKDSLLLKARKEAEDADKRCEKMSQDVANVRARLEKDLKIKSQQAKESLFKRLLPVLDSFDGALKSQELVKDVESVIKGLKQIHSQLCECCTAEGLEVLEAEGKPFDPNFFEAMGHVATNDIPEDCVYDELRRGYTLDGKLLRAAMVRLAVPDPSAPAPAAGKAADPECHDSSSAGVTSETQE